MFCLITCHNILDKSQPEPIARLELLSANETSKKVIKLLFWPQCNTYNYLQSNAFHCKRFLRIRRLYQVCDKNIPSIIFLLVLSKTKAYDSFLTS